MPGKFACGVLELLPPEYYCDWYHKQFDLKQGKVLAQETISINSSTTIYRDIKLLPLITEERGNNVVKLLVCITVECKNRGNFSYSTDIAVHLYDKEKMKVIQQSDKNFKFSDATNTGNFEVVLVSYDRIKDIKTDTLQVRVSTEVYATNVDEEYAMY